MEKEIGFIGLGKMGSPMVEVLKEKGFKVKTLDNSGRGTAKTIEELVESLETPRHIFLMVPHSVVGDVAERLMSLLSPGDTLLDGGNSFFKGSIEIAEKTTAKHIHFLDVGVSGGPAGARNGACLMVGGEKDAYDANIDIFEALAEKDGYQYMGKSGSGHFVKMVHNGIEYGMMQAIAEGFSVLKTSPFELNLTEIARLFSHGSVIDSKLIRLLEEGFEVYGEDLDNVSGSVAQSGEGMWTSEAAHDLDVPVPAIDLSVEFRKTSESHPSFTGKILSMLRNRFGGHSIDTPTK